MKKLILLTSALTMIGGAAVAEITVSGEATVSYGNWKTAPSTAATFSFGSSLTIAMEETTSNGLTYGAKITVDGDAGTIGNGVVYVSGGFGKVEFGVDEFDELSTAGAADAITGVIGNTNYGDVKYTGEFGGVAVTLVADAGVGVVAGVNASWDLGLAYTGAGFTLGLDTDSANAYKVSASVDVGNFTIGGAVKPANAWDLFVSTSFGAVNAKFTTNSGSTHGIALDGTSGDITWAVATNTANATSASVDYAMGDLSVGVAYDNDAAPLADRGDEADLQLTVGYSVDMLDFGLKFNDVNEYEISMTAGFEF
ncbi:MAG: porin [Paracoccaceae bacterium]